jgi:DNA-binding NarL/FixJ family response regulator
LASASNGRLPDQAALGQLRALVQRLHAANRDGTSLAEVVRLARELKLRSGVTVDFEATEELGHPLVVVRMPAGPPPPNANLDGLTPRQREVAALVAAGLTNKEIAHSLGIGVGTVKYYVHHILARTGLPGRVALATGWEATASADQPPSIFG